MNSITDAAADNPYVVRIGPGVYELGATRLIMKPFVDIVGAGQERTIIIGTGSDFILDGVVKGADDAGLRDLTVKNIGGSQNSVAILNNAASPRIERVTANASGGTVPIAVMNRSSSSPVMTQVTAIVGLNGIAISNGTGSSAVMTQVTAIGGAGLSNIGIITVFIRDSFFKGEPGGLGGVRIGSSAVRIINTQVVGGISNDQLGTQCNNVFDADLNQIDC